MIKGRKLRIEKWFLFWLVYVEKFLWYIFYIVIKWDVERIFSDFFCIVIDVLLIYSYIMKSL